MRIYKAFQRSFTPADNELLRCREISVFAKTIYLFIDSHCDAWEFSVERIAWALNISVDRARAGIRELENIGLLERERLNNAEGKKGWSVKYYLHDKESSPKSDYLKSIMEKSIMEKSIMEKSIMEKSASNIIIDIEKNIEKKNIKENTPAHASETALESEAVAPSDSLPLEAVAKGVDSMEPLGKKKGAEYSEEFAEFWEKYPKGSKKQEAFIAYARALSGKPARGKMMPKGLKPTHEMIMQGLERWVSKWKREGTEERFIPDASTWLNGMRYLDELEAPAHLRRGTKDYGGYLKEDSMLASEWVEKYYKGGKQ